MKQNFQGFLIFLIFAFLLFSYSTSARLLAPKHGEKELKANGISHPGSFIEITDLSNLMGSEDCEDKDEECLKRRLMAEAHLDYIYTQHHKP